MKIKSQRRDSIFLPLLPLIAVCLLLLGLSFFALRRAGLLTLLPEREGSETTAANHGELSALLDGLSNDEKNPAEVRALDNTAMRHILATGNFSNDYLHEYTVSYGVATDGEHFSLLRRGTAFHLLVSRGGETVREVTSDGRTATLCDRDTGVTLTQDAAADGYFEKTTSVVSAVDLVNFVINFGGAPTEWHFGTVLSCTAESIREESINMARITLDYDGRTEVYYLDIDRGCLYSLESRDAHGTYFKLTTTQFTYEIDTIDDTPVLLK